MYRNKGTITVFLSLISMLFLSLFCTMAESVRVQAARFQAAAAFDMGLFSILENMTEYFWKSMICGSWMGAVKSKKSEKCWRQSWKNIFSQISIPDIIWQQEEAGMYFLQSLIDVRWISMLLRRITVDKCFTVRLWKIRKNCLSGKRHQLIREEQKGLLNQIFPEQKEN